MSYFFTSESVSSGHPDKIADQISDAILDSFFTLDPTAKVACEVLVTTNRVIIAGEINTSEEILKLVDIEKVTREIIQNIGYTKSEYNFCYSTIEITNLLHSQSAEISQGVMQDNPDDQGAGDQGIMFGYAVNETPEFMPLPLMLSHQILIELENIRNHNTNQINYLRPDAKTQLTVEYDHDRKASRIDTVVLSTQHDEFDDDQQMTTKITNDVKTILIPNVLAKLDHSIARLFDSETTYHINPTGKFVIGGPDGDTGLTGRKIIVDTYGGRGAHGGGAFSGKDPSKVDRSAAYFARYLAKNLVASGICDEVLVQLSYAIGVAQPVSLYINTFGTNTTTKTDDQIAVICNQNIDMRPASIIKHLGLKKPIYLKTASGGHFGRKSKGDYFTWERLDLVDYLSELFV